MLEVKKMGQVDSVDEDIVNLAKRLIFGHTSLWIRDVHKVFADPNHHNKSRLRNLRLIIRPLDVYSLILLQVGAIIVVEPRYWILPGVSSTEGRVDVSWL